MSAIFDFDLSAQGERALQRALDRKPYAGDRYMRAGVRGLPSPADIVCLLDDASGKQVFGQCITSQEAGRLLQQLAAQPWASQAQPAAPQQGSYEVAVQCGPLRKTLQVQRFPQPHVVAISA